MTPARVLGAALAAWLALRALLALPDSMWAWGFGVSRFLPVPLGWGVLGAWAVLLLPPLGRGLAPALGRLGDALVERRGAGWIAFALGAVFVGLLPDRLWFVGDFVIRQGSAATGQFVAGSFYQSLPLDAVLHNAVPMLLAGGSLEGVNQVQRALGAVAAGGLAALAVAFARALGLRGAGALAAAAGAFFGGWLCVFTGLGKPAREMCLATLAVAAFGTRMARTGRGAAALGATLGLAFLTHRVALLLVPAALVAWRARARVPRRPPLGWRGVALGVAFPLLAAALVSRAVAILVWGFDVGKHLATPAMAAAGGPLAAAFSPLHLADVASIVTALAPLAFPALAAGLAARFAPRGPEFAVLAALALPMAAVVLFVHPQQGVFRDWDVLANAGLGLGCAAAALAGRLVQGDAPVDVRAAVPPDRGPGGAPPRPAAAATRVAAPHPAAAWLAAGVVASAVMPTFQWLALNHLPEAGSARVRAWVAGPPERPEALRAMTWDWLATHDFRMKRWEEAVHDAARAAELGPHPRVLLMWGLAATLTGRHAESQRVYETLLGREPAHPIGWLGLAGAALRTGDSATAARAIATLNSYAPGGPEAAMVRGYLARFPDVLPDLPAPPGARPGAEPGRVVMPPVTPPAGGATPAPPGSPPTDPPAPRRLPRRRRSARLRTAGS